MEYLKKIGLTIEQINSSDMNERRKARKKLAAAYPTQRVVIEFTNQPKLKTPTKFNGIVCWHPLSNAITTKGLATSDMGKEWRFLGFNGKITRQAGTSAVMPVVEAKAELKAATSEAEAALLPKEHGKKEATEPTPKKNTRKKRTV